MVAQKTLLNTPAPDFTLTDQSGHDVTLSSFKGSKNVVLIFYPGDMTAGCTLQLCAIRDDWSKFQTADTVVFGMNHGDAQSHKAFAEKYSYPFPLLIDKDKKVSAKYGAIIKLGRFSIIRRTVVGIDKTGRIVYLKRGMPKDADILKAIQTTDKSHS
ncbi:MAG: peroxiredoxin [Patescibacteria group bacterium]